MREREKKKGRKKEGKRDSGRGAVTCALSYNRGNRPGIWDQMTRDATRRFTFMLSRGGRETPLSDAVTLLSNENRW